MMYLFYFLLMTLTSLLSAEQLQIGVLTSTEDHSWDKSVVVRPSFWSDAPLTIQYTAIQLSASVNIVSAWNAVCSHINNGVRVYLSTLSCDQPNQVVYRSIEHKLVSHDLPLIRLKSCDAKCQGLCIPVSKTNRDVIDIILSIATYQHWQEVAIIYDVNNMTSQTLNLLLEEFSERAMSVVLLSIEDLVNTQDIRWQLQHVTGFVVMTANQNQLQYVLKQARMGYLDLLGPSFQWILLSEPNWNRTAIKSLLREGDNVAMVTYTDSNDTSTPAVINKVEMALYEVTANHSEYVASDNMSCSEGSVWPHGEDLAYQVKNVLLQTISTTYHVLSLRRESAEELGFVGVAQYSQSGGLILTYHALFPQLFEGFNNRTFLITTVHELLSTGKLTIPVLIHLCLLYLYGRQSPPFTIDLKNGSWAGIVFDLINELAYSLNFSYEILSADSYGIEKNGVYSGMMGLIQKKQVDFGAATFTMTSARDQVADFTTPFWVDPSVLLMKKPSLIRAQLFVCFDPFTLYVWLILALSVIVVGAVIWGFNRVDPTLPKIIKVKRYINQMDLTLWQVFGALFQQGMVHDPESHSARMVTSFWWLFTIVIVGTYNGNLIAYLTSPRINVPINNLQDLSESSLDYGFVAETSTHQMFTNASPGSIYGQLWERVKSDPNKHIMESSEDGLRKVLRDDSYVFLCDKSFYDTIAISSPGLEDSKCDIVRSEDEFLKNMYALAFPKDSPYTHQFSMRILHLLEAGLFERWRNKWYGVDNRCTGLERNIAQTNIGFGESQGAFYVLVMGLVLSLIFFSVEKYIQLRKSSVMQKKRDSEDKPIESKSQDINGLNIYRQNDLNHRHDIVAGDIQLHHTESDAVSSTSIHSVQMDEIKSNGCNGFGLSGVYSRVFSVSNIDDLPCTSTVQSNTYNTEPGDSQYTFSEPGDSQYNFSEPGGSQYTFSEPGDSQYNFNTRYSTTSEYSSPVHFAAIDEVPERTIDKSIYYTLTSECTKL